MSNQVSQAGIIPYSDIDLILTNGSVVRVGLRAGKRNWLFFRSKGLGKSGVPGFEQGINTLDKMFPNLREMFVSSLLEYYTSKGFTNGVSIPTVYGKLPEKMKETALLGSKDFGGKVDYIIAIDKVPFTWKKIRIPAMSHGFVGSEFVIEILESKAFDASEILANNNLYIWVDDTEGRTLYLGNDKVDKNNLPAVLGPGLARRMYYGIKKFKVGLNVDSKMQFEIADNKNVFKLVLKSPSDLHPSSPFPTKPLPYQDTATDDDEFSNNRGIMVRDKAKEQLNRKEYGSSLSPDERETAIETIVANTTRGFKHRFKTELTWDQRKNIENQLENETDNDLVRLKALESHRLAVEIKRMYL
jgi:hypothetical protein